MANKLYVYPLTYPTKVSINPIPVEVQVSAQTQTVETTLQSTPVQITVPDTVVYTIGIQGPPGPAGAAGEEEVPYAKELDDQDPIVYTGWANPGSLTSAAVWRIRRRTLITDVSGNTDFKDEWADGDANFDNIWDNHLTLNYS